jgi:hypothetical protein
LRPGITDEAGNGVDAGTRPGDKGGRGSGDVAAASAFYRLNSGRLQPDKTAPELPNRHFYPRQKPQTVLVMRRASFSYEGSLKSALLAMLTEHRIAFAGDFDNRTDIHARLLNIETALSARDGAGVMDFSL